MLDFFTIFSKGGIVLWCFQGAGVKESFTGPVNALIRSVILQERSGSNSFTHERQSLKYKLDNEFELIFVVGFQNILTLTYVDKFIDDVQLRFRDRYKNELVQKGALMLLNNSFEFEDDFQRILREAEESSRTRSTTYMRAFQESEKSKKTVKSMIETKGGDKGKEQGGKKSKSSKKELEKPSPPGQKTLQNGNQGLTQEEIIQKKREEFIRKHTAGPTEKPSLPHIQRGRRGGGGSGQRNKQTKVFPVFDCLCMPGFSFYANKHLVCLPPPPPPPPKKGGGGGGCGWVKGWVGSKSLSQEDMEPVLEKMKEHLIAKNVAAEIASQLCDSVAKKLEGKVMGTFTTVASTVKQALQDSLVQILQPKRRVDILRDVMEAQSQRRPFVITFCGVNGVGKSTNLAKISYWLIENGFTVLIAACDTFRAGAVEQLRTHQRRLNALHPPEKHGGQPVVQLYEKGYGKDAAGIAMEAIAYARNQAFDVVLVDTAGRMQDNAPLMTALAKLIAVNMPDLVLFVGEALVGNEAVDQLVKFNQALADHSMSEKPRLIDGIVLTKFDTIDDKVGAAISMTYITGQPIVFVGTGQTYNDLRSLNARAVVGALMKA
uniref:SRP receptor subunit alpha n=1 Tax=Oryzias sinensis TaxID=183150 RepID=A0A8C8DMS2_9TELE